MGISYERHGDRTYVYRVSSRREAGRKNPVSYKEYLGVLDEGSGTIIPKPIPLDEIPPAFHDGRFRMMEYGNVRVCGSVAERLFIKDDLESVFGDCYRTILALAISRAISPGSTSDPTRIADRLFLADVLGHSRRLSQDSIRKAAGAISYDSVKRFYGLSRERHPQHTYLFMVSDPMNRTRGNSHESYRHPSLSDACIILMADDSGDPFAAGLTFGRKGDARIFAEFVSKDPKSYTLVVGDGRADAKMMAKAIMGRTEVMVQCTSGIDRIIHMLAPTIEHYMERSETRTSGGREYLVMEADLNLVLDGKWGFVAASDGHKGFRVHAYLCADMAVNRRRIATMRRIMNDKDAGSTRVGSDGSGFRLFPGVDSCADAGEIPVKSQVSGTTKEARALWPELSLILSTSHDWEGCMEAIRLRNACVRHANHIGSAMYGDGTKRYRFHEFFIDALALRIRLGIERALRREGSVLSVDDALGIASTYGVISEGGDVMFSECSKQARDVMNILVEGRR